MPYGDPFGTQAGCFVQEEYSLVFIEDAWTAEAACGLITGTCLLKVRSD